MKRFALLAAIAVTVAAVVVGWRTYERQPGGDDDRPSPSPRAEQTTEPTPTATPTPARLPRAPREGACHRLSYADAVAPTTAQRDVPCGQEHTSVTFAVGELDTVVDGHLVTIDTDRVRGQVADRCPDLFADHVGGTLEQRRLSLLRPVGFTPTVEQSDRGAAWFRCDVVAVAQGNRLSPVQPDLRGVLDTEAGRDRYGRCATAGPGSPGFGTVTCDGDHSWRAVRTVPLPDGAYPGAEAVREAGTQPCRAAGREAADDALDFEWGYEWPTAEQWRQGRTFGICWVPE